MRQGLFTALLLVAMASPAAPPEPIRNGDYLFLRGQIVGCGDSKQVIDYSHVDDAGVASLFGIDLEAAGRGPVEVAAELADGIGERQGSRPDSLEITVVAPADHKNRATLLMMLIGRMRHHYCTPKPLFDVPRELPDYRLAEVWR